ncbi:hypothetical protein PF008_g25619 [Phytophthora fragariae]|uniref:Uncharacterized protein n=1 Tax=Phytophthora fragariae TaxID=53985 RepID=A0A6G0QJG0_9STRA|nr:hypothetical protein PF008_g25619 [Phytophthora fragariae]
MWSRRSRCTTSSSRTSGGRLLCVVVRAAAERVVTARTCAFLRPASMAFPTGSFVPRVPASPFFASRFLRRGFSRRDWLETPSRDSMLVVG